MPAWLFFFNNWDYLQSTITKYLQPEALLAPVDESSLGGGSLNQVSGLAGLAGFALPSADGGSNANKAIQVMGSLAFLRIT